MNPLQACIRQGRPALGMLLTIPSPTVAQVLAAAGLDWLFIDMEHAPFDLESAHAIIAATKGTECAVVARVPTVQRWLAKPLLDAGAHGIVFPMVCSRAEAEEAALAVRYPPVGERGYGPFYAPARWGLSMADYIARANDYVTCMPLIEHIDAVRNLDDILSVPGLDVGFIAPFDLSASLGHPGEREHPAVAQAIATAEEKIAASPLALGGLARDAEDAAAMVARGYQAVMLGFDIGYLEGAVRASIEHIRG